MIKKNAILLIFSIVFPALVFGQGETSNWYFGNNAGIHFNNNGTVTALNDGRLETFEGCTTISNDLGDLLFYTDGIIVYDRNHNVMQNGTGLFGDPSSTQSALIVPKPEDPNIYYIFTVDTSTSTNDPDFGLNYSIVDITLNSGNGAITQKNTRLLNDCSEKIAAVLKDCSDKTIWIVTLSSQFGSGGFDTYHAFEISASGVSTNVVKSTFSKLSIEDPRGYLKFSNDGKKMASANMRFGLHLFDFDPLTGVVSNFQELVINSANNNPYGVEFSPNSRFLYTHSSNFVEGEAKHASSLIQFDLDAPNITDSQVAIDYKRIYRGALQLGANGKIYRTIADSYDDGTPFLGVINNPNEKGDNANYQHNAIALGNNSTQGLPPFIQSFFNKTDLIFNADGTSSGSTTICIGEPFTLQAEEIPGAVYNWEKDGNPIINPDNHLLHIDEAENIDAGRYSLEIILPSQVDCNILGESLIEVLELPQNTDLTLVQCDVDIDNTEDGFTGFNLDQIDENPAFIYSFYENIANRDNDIQIENIQNYRNSNPFNQIIYYRVMNTAGCENFGELELQVRTVNLDDENRNTLFACDENLNDQVLSATFSLESVTTPIYPNSLVSFYDSLENLALEQEPLPSNIVSESRVVYARIENSNQCEDVLEIELVVNPTPLVDLNKTYELCTDDPFLNIYAPLSYDYYNWMKIDGASPQILSNTQEIAITEVGGYTLEVGYTYQNNGQVQNCTNSYDFEVIPSNRAVIENIFVKDFSNNNSLLVEASGDGDYEFSTNGVEYSDSNFFQNVIPGVITVSIRDKKGCGIVEKTVSVMGYPKFFTPNGDTINDKWNLIGLSSEIESNSVVSIFDRYGRLLTVLYATNEGWNGDFNTKPVPSGDYWFKAELGDGRIFNGHFALKR
ncbi:T9SS type B sorting domain-containing protein [Maribacter sp. HTCC2170]|uniref:T9SS type B sorting domain-containing protein n=1 Tax=Maribacter sp. (strain HTCC2170 / KCCM 42371) TaxID=313603 RepID=UPI00006B2191|nr:T9SS type B sorting domain-containing protein [Maribacter sp. HTCC2170]EAR00180.1 hypothetical protein FB2170_00900 [Maribacter sp. HTCC2170]